jgi:hypothetical protein
MTTIRSPTYENTQLVARASSASRFWAKSDKTVWKEDGEGQAVAVGEPPDDRCADELGRCVRTQQQADGSMARAAESG